MKGHPRPYLFFGKLPDYSDFVRYNASGDDVRTMESWVNEGLYRAERHFGDQWAAVYQRAAPHFFLFDPENRESVLTGILKPSRDRSGRRYPFIIARRMEALQGGEGAAFVLSRICSAPLASLETLLLDRPDTPPAEISSRLERIADPLSPMPDPERKDFDRYLRSTSLDDLWDSVCADPESPNKRVLERNLLELARLLRAAGSIPRASGMSFPLSRDLSTRLREVCFWTKYVLTVRNNTGTFPTLFWPASAEGSSSRLFVFLSRPSPRAFLSLMDPNADQDTIFRADGEERAAADGARSGRPSAAGAPLRSKGMTLDEFLAGL
jgi:type VI secretion system protein ImpM